MGDSGRPEASTCLVTASDKGLSATWGPPKNAPATQPVGSVLKGHPQGALPLSSCASPHPSLQAQASLPPASPSAWLGALIPSPRPFTGVLTWSRGTSSGAVGLGRAHQRTPGLVPSTAGLDCSPKT